MPQIKTLINLIVAMQQQYLEAVVSRPIATLHGVDSEGRVTVAGVYPRVRPWRTSSQTRFGLRLSRPLLLQLL